MRKKIVDKLVEEFSENVDDSEMIYNVTLNYYENVYGSYTIYAVLFAFAFLITIGISSTFIYFNLCLKLCFLKQQFTKHIKV